jgi:hypothetical protein
MIEHASLPPELNRQASAGRIRVFNACACAVLEKQVSSWSKQTLLQSK